MKNKILALFVLFFLPFLWKGAGASSQNVGINSTGAAPNAMAGLDIDITGKGLLIPRVTLLQRTNPGEAGGLIALGGAFNSGLPAQGLVVYQTDATQGFYYNISTLSTPTWAIFTATLSPSAPAYIPAPVEPK